MLTSIINNMENTKELTMNTKIPIKILLLFRVA